MMCGGQVYAYDWDFDIFTFNAFCNRLGYERHYQNDVRPYADKTRSFFSSKAGYQGEAADAYEPSLFGFFIIINGEFVIDAPFDHRAVNRFNQFW